MSPALTVNGASRTFSPDDFPATVAALVSAMGLEGGMVVAEVNGEIVRRDAQAAHPLTDGDHVELVRFVGGG
jgi:sulfur carrier protein